MLNLYILLLEFYVFYLYAYRAGVPNLGYMYLNDTVHVTNLAIFWKSIFAEDY